MTSTHINFLSQGTSLWDQGNPEKFNLTGKLFIGPLKKSKFMFVFHTIRPHLIGDTSLNASIATVINQTQYLD